MSETFNCLPSVEGLKFLTASSLKQNLGKSLRLYVIVYSIYEESEILKLELEDKFTFGEWKNKFFIDAEIHHQRDNKPKSELHHPHCRCSISLKDWLFSFYPDPIDQKKWCKKLQKELSLIDQEVTDLLTWGKIINNEQEITRTKPTDKSRNNSKREALPGGRLFAVTGKSLENDFDTLVTKGLLNKSKNNQGKYVFSKVDKFPNIPTDYPDDHISELGDILNPDLATTVKIFGLPINGVNRLSIYLDYIISDNDAIEDLEEQLKNIWQQESVTPIRFTYSSASLWKDITRIVYPVCIYYYQRALYLSAYGQLPKQKHLLGWNNYRLDKITTIEQLNWQDQSIPLQLFQEYTQHKLPDVAKVKEEIDYAWGLDFYQPSSLMLLRFNQDFHERYIEDTFRHFTFQKIPSIEEVKYFINNQQLSIQEKNILLNIVKNHPEDAYYQARYRVNDNNVIMRLRAWNPNIEVLLPGELREQMIQEVLKTWKMYYPDGDKLNE